MGCAPYPTVFFVFVSEESEPLFMLSHKRGRFHGPCLGRLHERAREYRRDAAGPMHLPSNLLAGLRGL